MTLPPPGPRPDRHRAGDRDIDERAQVLAQIAHRKPEADEMGIELDQRLQRERHDQEEILERSARKEEIGRAHV